MSVQLPPRTYVDRVVGLLQDAGLPVALGGSALLAALGLVDRVHDWDVTVDADPSLVLDHLLTDGLVITDRTTRHPPYATQARLVVDAADHEVDVLVGFAVDDGTRVVPIPARVDGYWHGLPLAEAGPWAVAYRVLGRTRRADLLDAWLAEHRGR